MFIDSSLTGNLVVDAQVMGQAARTGRGMEVFARGRGVFEHGTDIAYRPVRAQAMVEGLLASLLEALLRVRAA